MRQRLLNIVNELFPTNRNVWIDTCTSNGNWYLVTLFFQNEYKMFSLRELHSTYSDEKIIQMFNL